MEKHYLVLQNILQDLDIRLFYNIILTDYSICFTAKDNSKVREDIKRLFPEIEFETLLNENTVGIIKTDDTFLYFHLNP